ncbi:hypothetical protein HAV15_004465 [Penicillium sp. str. |nr:hypothetical protein HAV15_004465 [Penicillium sp. str. \
MSGDIQDDMQSVIAGRNGICECIAAFDESPPRTPQALSVSPLYENPCPITNPNNNGKIPAIQRPACRQSRNLNAARIRKPNLSRLRSQMWNGPEADTSCFCESPCPGKSFHSRHPSTMTPLQKAPQASTPRPPARFIQRASTVTYPQAQKGTAASIWAICYSEWIE